MTKRQTWIFFLFGTLACTVAFIGMTIHTHTKFDEITHSDKLTPQVVRGMDVWHAENCINCHTLLGGRRVLCAGSHQDHLSARHPVFDRLFKRS